jgi:hypothetical protein
VPICLAEKLRVPKGNDRFFFWGRKIQSESVAESYWSVTLPSPAGVDMRTLQEWMGHSDITSTMRYLKPNRGQAVRDKVEATFG